MAGTGTRTMSVTIHLIPVCLPAHACVVHVYHMSSTCRSHVLSPGACCYRASPAASEQRYILVAKPYL